MRMIHNKGILPEIKETFGRKLGKGERGMTLILLTFGVQTIDGTKDARGGASEKGMLTVSTGYKPKKGSLDRRIRTAGPHENQIMLRYQSLKTG